MIDWKDVNKELPKYGERVLYCSCFRLAKSIEIAVFVDGAFRIDAIEKYIIPPQLQDKEYWAYINKPKEKTK